MYRMRAGLLRIALATLACQLAGVPALAMSTIRGTGGETAVLACCLNAGPGHVCPMMHRTTARARAGRRRCAITEGCTSSPAVVAALGLVLLASPVLRFAVALDARACAAWTQQGSRPTAFVPAIPAPPPWA